MREALWLSGEGKGGGSGNVGGRKGGGGGGGGGGCRALEEQNENDGIDFDRDGGTLGNRATGATLHLRSAGQYITLNVATTSTLNVATTFTLISHTTSIFMSFYSYSSDDHNFAQEWLILIGYTNQHL